MTDHGAFEAFVLRYQDMVFATAVRLLGRSAEAEDVAQAVFLRAFQHFETLDGNPAAAGWLKTTTRNLCLNHLSRHRARWFLFSELGREGDQDPRNARKTGVDPSAVGGGVGEFGATEGDAATDPRIPALERALRALPEHQRVPLVLYHFEEMSYQEIADTLGVTLGKVKTDIHRGRRALKAHIEYDDDRD